MVSGNFGTKFLNMYKDKKILCIIPARGGSKRLPGKNIKLLNGVPLIGYAIRSAKGSQYIDKVIVSTDDEEIARVAREQGAEVPFMRTADLADDIAPTLPVLQHAVTFFEEKGEQYDLVVLIQPTVPGVESNDVDTTIEKLIEADVHSAITVCPIINPPEWMYRLEADGRLQKYIEASAVRGQDLEKLYIVNGAVYVTEHDTLMEGGKIVDNDSCAGIIMPRERSTDIDTLADFQIAEMMLKGAGTSIA